MPWSMPFQGNFFIHGWPHYRNGAPVESAFSGGCIRLFTQDAEQVYKATKVGAPVLVHEKDFAADRFNYEKRPPDTTASRVLAADLKSNFVFAQKNSGEPVPVASITKLLTALVVTEYINIEKELTVPERKLPATSKPRLRAGERVSVYDLLYALLGESSNEAAETIASALGPKYFLHVMNEKARALGMIESRFADASGQSPENVSTAEDLFGLAKYLYNSRGFVLRVSAGKVERPDLYGAPSFFDLKNFNLFAEDPVFVGGKAGKTEAAKETFLGVFEFQSRGQTRPIAVIVLGSEDIEADVRAVLNHLKSAYLFDFSA